MWDKGGPVKRDKGNSDGMGERLAYGEAGEGHGSEDTGQRKKRQSLSLSLLPTPSLFIMLL